MKQAQTTLSELGTAAAAAFFSQLGRQILKVCVSFLRLWNIHCSAQEVVIFQFISAVSDSCRHHKVSWVQGEMEVWDVENSSKCCRAFVAFTPFSFSFFLSHRNMQHTAWLSLFTEGPGCKNNINNNCKPKMENLYYIRAEKESFNISANSWGMKCTAASAMFPLCKQRIIQLSVA